MWEDMEWNEPDRHDHYSMQIAMWAARAVSSQASSNLGKFKIPFTSAGKPVRRRRKRRRDVEPGLSEAAGAAAAMVGSGRFVLRRVDKDGNLVSEEVIGGSERGSGG